MFDKKKQNNIVEEIRITDDDIICFLKSEFNILPKRWIREGKYIHGIYDKTDLIYKVLDDFLNETAIGNIVKFAREKRNFKKLKYSLIETIKKEENGNKVQNM